MNFKVSNLKLVGVKYDNKNYASSSLSGARPPGAFGPPALLAIIIWSTFKIVHAACVAYCNPQNLER